MRTLNATAEFMTHAMVDYLGIIGELVARGLVSLFLSLLARGLFSL